MDTTRAEPTVKRALHRCVAEWQGAASLFAEATEPAVIDYAIYAMNAAESLYRHIVAQAAHEGIPISGAEDMRLNLFS